MKQTIPLRVQLSLTEYKSTTPAWIYIFNRSVCGPCETKQQLVNGAATVPIYSVTDTIKISSTFWCFVSVERQMKPDGNATDSKFFHGSQPFLTRAGFATFTLPQCETAGFKPSSVYDIDGNDMGKLELRLDKSGKYKIKLDDDDKDEATEFKWCLPCMQLEAWTEYSSLAVQQIHNKYFSGGTNITSQLPRFMLTTIKQHCGTIPMWAFVPLNLQSYPDCQDYLQRSVENAAYLLGKQSQQDDAYVAELLNEMQTLPVRAQLYALDTSKVQGQELSVDDWTNPRWAVVPRLHAFDCEDGALRMIQDALWLHDAKDFQKGSLLATVQAAEREYLTFFACMTLYLPGSRQWTYHAAVLKLDKQTTLNRLGLTAAASSKKQQRRPAVLLEATAYTTGCWKYCSDTYTEQVAKASKAHFGRGDTICKDTSKAVQTKKLYGHIQTLFSPVLFREYGVLQIELGYKDKLAAPTDRIMNYDTGVQFYPVQLSDTKKLLQDIEKLQYAAYPLPALPTVSANRGPPSSNEYKAGEANFCVRKVDWDDPSTQQDLSDLYNGAKLRGTVLEIAKDLEIVHVTL